MKTAITNLRSFKYIFWASPALIVAGLTAGVIAGDWGVVSLTLLIVGIAIAIVWLLLHSNSLPNFLGRRSTQAGTNALISTLAVLVIVGLINFLGVRYANRIDLTDNQRFTLSPQTVEIVRDLDQPIRVVIFDAAPNPQDEALLENYRRENPQLSFEYIDPQRELGVAREFAVQTLGEVHLERGDQRQLVQTVSAEERLSERRLTNGLVQISGAEPRAIAVVQGHGERTIQPGQGSISEAIARLQDENYTAEPLGLAQANISTDTSVVIVAGPKRPLLPAEVTKLRTYLTQKSGVLLMLDPQVDSGLTPLLSEWGLTLANDRLIVDPAGESAGLGLAVPLVTQYGDHPITRDLGNGISFYPGAQPIAIAEKPGITATPIVITDERTSAQQTDASGQLVPNPAVDPKGPLVIGVALSKSLETEPTPSPSPSPAPNAEEQSKPEARLVVFGNSGFITDTLFSQQLNGDIFLNSVSWLSQGDDEALSIRPKEQTNRRLLLSGRQQILISLLALLVFPVVAFALAFGLWWTRR